MKHRNLYYLVLLLAASLPLPIQLSAQGTVWFSEPVSISTEGNHALAAMLAHIQHLYSTAINFEEAPVEYFPDLQVSPVLLKSGSHPIAIRGGKLTVQLDKNDRTAYQATQIVLAAYVSSGLPGVYQAIDEGERVDVVPVETRMASGATRRVTPIMDVSITLNYQPRGAYQVMQDISAAIAKASRDKVYLVSNGANESPKSPEPVGFPEEKARDMFAKAVGGFANQALFDPGEKAYYLNVAPITLPSAPAPAVARNPILTRDPETSPFWVKK